MATCNRYPTRITMANKQICIDDTPAIHPLYIIGTQKECGRS
jgi:ribosomal protein L31